MDANIENIKRTKAATKIPLPVKPLPAIPNHLVTKSFTRAPLKTIKSINENIASSSVQIVKMQIKKKKKDAKLVKKCDLGCVTKRVKYLNQNVLSDDIDSLFKPMLSHAHADSENLSKASVTKTRNLILAEGKQKRLSDDRSKQDNGVVIISSDDNNEIGYDTNAEKNNIPGPSQLSLITPIAPIENKIVKNVKKSLKRPHSRELQGILKTSNQEKASDKVKRRLAYDEKTILTPDIWEDKYTAYLDQVYAEDILEYLLKIERKPKGVSNIDSLIRACAINWLIKINGPHGNPANIQSAIWYLDSFLYKVAVPLRKLQVVAAASFWIAQKHHGHGISAKKMVAYSKDAFTAKSLVAIEKKILQELEYNQPVVPQEFISYLAWWCDKKNSEEIELAATFLCLTGLQVDKSLCQEYPSVIAVAAVKNALILLNKCDLQPHLRQCPVFNAAAKKENQPVTHILQQSVVALNSPFYTYDVLLNHYNSSPYCIAQRIVTAAEHLADTDIGDGRKYINFDI